jgi:hypothetical protein
LPLRQPLAFETDPLPSPWLNGSPPLVESFASELLRGSIRVSWTSVTPDLQLVQQLVREFFSSSHSSLLQISQSHFLKDFCDGNHQYCSEALVNVMLGMACGVLDSRSQSISKVSFTNAFLGEARRLLAIKGSHTMIPNIQALGLMALIEVGLGNEEEAWNLAHESVRSSILLALQPPSTSPLHEQDSAVRGLSFCGGFTILRCVRLSICGTSTR